MIRFIAGWIAGFDRDWWSNKHNTHHILTNHVGGDPDIDMMPILFLMAPSKALDHHARRYQHIYAWPLYSLLYAAWRMSSLEQTIKSKNWKRLVFDLAPSYIWLSLLPLSVAVGSILLSGFL